MSSLAEQYNNIKNQLISIQNQINSFNKNFDFLLYFKQEFERIIKCSIENYGIKVVFNILFYSFNYDFYIFLKSKEEYKKYYDLNNLTDEDIQELISKFIEYYCNFYKDNISEIIKGSLTLNECYINNNDITVKYINFNEYTNEYIINISKNIKDKYNSLLKIFEHIRYLLTVLIFVVSFPLK